jgi:hypothetical protein
MIWLAAAVAVGAWATNTYGQTAVTWDGTTGAYTTATNWNPDVVPSNATNEFLMINNGGTAQVSDIAEGAFLYLGLQPGDTGHLTIDGGTMTLGEMRVGGLEAIPDLVTPTNPPTPNGGGTGTIVQNGGTVNLTYSTGTEPPRQSLWVGDAGLASGNTANGSYTITGTEASPAVLVNGIANNDGIFIGTGVGTIGAFTQNAFTTVTSTGFVNVGRRGSTGTYNLNGGTLNTNAGGTNTALLVGDGETGIQTTSGTFNQSGGTFNLTGVGIVGRRGGDGFYNLSAGDLIVNGGSTGLVLGDGLDATNAPGTSGTFTQTGGTVTTTAALIGRRNGEGFYKISAGSLNSSGDVRVPDLGSTTAGLGTAQGTLEVSGAASVTVGTNLNIGLGSTTVASSVVGTLKQTGGSIVLSGTGATVIAIGNGIGASGTANLSGGTLSQTAGSATANLDIGRNSSSGIVNISGTHIFTGRQVTLNSTNVAATRQLNISGGTVDVDTLTFGTVASQATRLLDISGGTVNIGALTTGQAAAGGQALTYIHGGTVTLENTVEYFTGSVFRLGSINLAVPANTTYGNATVDVLAGSTLTQNGSFGTGAASRTLTKTGLGTMTIAGTQSYAATAAAIINAGTMNYNAAAAGTNLTVTVSSPGILGGTGTVGGAITNNGTIAPGVASGTNIGTLTTNAGVTDGANSNWAIELNGASSDKLVVNGNIDLSAVDALNVSGSPGSSTSWIIGTYTGTLTGLFDTVTSGYSVTYTGGNITLNLAGLPGDFNSDGKVDAGDYVTWRKNDGTNNALANDNGLGTPIGQNHYNLWRANFGKPPGSGSGLDGAQVPEPASCALLCVMFWFLGIRRLR